MTELIHTLRAGRRPRPRALVVPILLLAALCVAVLSVSAVARTEERDGEPRTITLSARDMSFYLADSQVKNPPVVVERGELVRLVLKNDDPGMAHDLVVPTLDLKTPQLKKSGTTTEVVLRAPARPGSHAYFCSLHALLMRGVLEVR
jgi:plastocyanin